MKTLLEMQNDFQTLQTTHSFDKWNKFSNQASAIHLKLHTEQSRVFLRQFYKLFVKHFINTMNNNTSFIKVCFKYARMFKDITELLEYFKHKKLGTENVEYVLQLSQYYLYCSNDRQKAIFTLEHAKSSLKKDQQIERSKIDQMLQKILKTASYLIHSTGYQQDTQNIKVDEKYIQQSSQQQLQNKTVQFAEISPLELRLYDYYTNKINANKIMYTKQQVKPYNQIAHNQQIISQMVDFLKPSNQLNVYYSSNASGENVILTQPYNMPRIDSQIVSYIEFIDEIPNQLAIGQQLQFTSFTENILSLQQELGKGGFGQVFRADLLQNRDNYQIAAKFFFRKKDQLLLDQQYSISSSYLRELYALAVLLQRATLLSSNDVLTQIDVPFTKLYCGLIGRSGNGAILMQYVKGTSLYDIIKSKSQSDYADSLNSTQILQYLKLMIETVQLVHQCDVLHSDLKIDNWILPQNSQKLVLCDFGKAVDCQLFLCNTYQQQPLVFNYSNLNSVSPSPSCQNGYLFAADTSGLASCLYSLLTGSIMSQDEIVNVNDANSANQVRYVLTTQIQQDIAKKYKHSDVLLLLFDELFNYSYVGCYKDAKQHIHSFLQQLVELIEQQ